MALHDLRKLEWDGRMASSSEQVGSINILGLEKRPAKPNDRRRIPRTGGSLPAVGLGGSECGAKATWGSLNRATVVYKDHATHLTDLPIASASEKNLLSAMEHHIVHNNKSDTILPKEESVPSCHDEVAATPKLGHDGLPLVPQPSDDPYDPLNWPVVQKLGILFVICFLGLIGPLNVSAIAPSLLVIAEELKCEVALTTYLVGGPLLAYGVSALFWVAVANTFGVRLVFVVATLIGGLLSIWGAMANNFASLAASRTLATVFMATCETLAPQAIADVFYLKDRAKCLGVYVFFTASSFGIGGLVGAYVSADLGWRWVQWIQVILTLLCSLLVFLFYPETQYTRTSAATHPRKRRAIDYISFHAVSGGGRKKVDSFWRALAYPLRYFPHPVVLIMTFHLATILMTVNYAITSNTFIYQGEYGFDVKRTGLTSLSPFLATCLALPYTGYLNDRYINRYRHRKDFQPEWRLKFFFLTLVLGPVGCIIMGVTAQNHANYATPLIGEGLIMFCFSCSIAFVQLYIVDVYVARADAALMIMNGVKNVAAFAISYGVVPWNTSAGYAVPFGVLAVLVVVAHVPVLALLWKGQQIREWSAKHFEDAKPTYHGDSF